MINFDGSPQNAVSQFTEKMATASDDARACLRPNFIVIGAAKCATSSLCRMLSEHPQVYFSPIKEPKFFCDDTLFTRKGWPWYESLFFEGRDSPFRGEGSTYYTMRERYPRTVERIANALPDVKLIYMVRHPLRQIESYWIQERANGCAFALPDFNQAIRERFDWITPPANYMYQLEPYLSRFSRDQILVQFFEDFCQDPVKVVGNCLAFIGAEADLAPQTLTPKENISDGKLLLDPRFDYLRDTSVVRALKWMLPAQLKRSLTRKLFVRVPWSGRPAWNESTRAMVIDKLAAPTREFLLEQGRTPDYWDFRI